MKEGSVRNEIAPKAADALELLRIVQAALPESKYPFASDFGGMIGAMEHHFLGEGVFLNPSYRILGAQDVYHPSDVEDLLRGRSLKSRYLVVSNSLNYEIN